MSSARQNKFEGLCRLCTSVENNNLQIFGDEGEFRQLASKIRICLPIFVHREDTLPKVVCLPCVTKLESFYNFREACVKAEGTLEAFLKEEQNFPHEPEICLEEVTTAKAGDTVNSECEGEVGNGGTKRKAEKQPRGRRKKKSTSEKPALQGGRKAKRGKGVKVLEQPKDPPPLPEQVVDLNGKEEVVEEKGTEEVGQQLEELPVPLSPASNLSQTIVPQMGELHPDDYILIKEEKFLAGANWGISNLFPPNNGGFSFIKEEIVEGIVAKDGECLDLSGGLIDGIKTEVDSENLVMRQTRQFLPPVWDVFEKVMGDCRNDGRETAVVTHRRYIVAKRAFPCALCGNCFMLSGAGDVMENGRGGGGRARYLNNEHIGESTERPFGCLRCEKRYFRRSDLIRHEKTHLASRPFVCSLCGKGFCRKEHAQRHMSLHVGEKPFQCEACFKPFTRKEHLARHQRCHHPEALYNTEGSYSYGSAEDQEYSMHEEANGSNKVGDVSGGVTSPQATSTPTKSKALVDKSAVMEAMKALPKRPYECEICVQAFSRREHLVRHRRSHFREQMKAVSLTLSANRQVIRMGEEIDMSAPPSSLVDTVIDGLEDEEEQDMEGTEQSCRYCTLTFPSREELERHQSRMHPLAEAVSAMVPQSEEALADLYGTMHKQTPVARSPSPPHLVSEERRPEDSPTDDGTVGGKQAFPCILCPHSFSRKENLERHLKTVHVRLKPYVCQWCGKRFGRTELCRRHENRHLQKQVRYAADSEEVAPKFTPPFQGSPAPCAVGSNVNEIHGTKKSSDHRSKEVSSPRGPTGNNRLENGSECVAPDIELGVGDNINGKDAERGKVKRSKSRGAKNNDSSGKVDHQSSKGSKRIKVYTCQVCGMEFSKKKHLAKHGNTHA